MGGAISTYRANAQADRGVEPFGDTAVGLQRACGEPADLLGERPWVNAKLVGQLEEQFHGLGVTAQEEIARQVVRTSGGGPPYRRDRAGEVEGPRNDCLVHPGDRVDLAFDTAGEVHGGDKLRLERLEIDHERTAAGATPGVPDRIKTDAREDRQPTAISRDARSR